MRLYEIDPTTNREVVNHGAALAELAALGGREDLGSRGTRVVLLRLLGRLSEAEQEGAAAWRLAASAGSPAQRVAALARYAHVRQWQGAFADAEAMLAEARAQATVLDDPLLLAFVRQHTGRCRFDQGRFEEAADEFVAALMLQETHGASADQIESARQALVNTRARLRRQPH